MIQTLRKKYQDIISENQKAPVEEQLFPTELVVDEQFVKELDQENDKKISETRREIQLRNMKKELLRQKIKKECW
ncbi:hypothetical protein OFN63_38550, partial [Escherichia coli]|nr:hypothetical protein [Escherichia coli]